MVRSFHEHLKSPLVSILVGLVFGVSLLILGIAYGGPGAFTPVTGWGSIKQVGGSVGMGFSPTDPNPGSTLAIKGSASLGSQFVGITAPFNSLIVEGDMGVGTANPGARLGIQNGGIIMGGTPQRGFPNERVPQGNTITDTGNQNPAASTPLSIAIGKDGLPLKRYAIIFAFTQGSFCPRIQLNVIDARSMSSPPVVCNVAPRPEIANTSDGTMDLLSILFAAL